MRVLNKEEENVSVALVELFVPINSQRCSTKGSASTYDAKSMQTLA